MAQYRLALPNQPAGYLPQSTNIFEVVMVADENGVIQNNFAGSGGVGDERNGLSGPVANIIIPAGEVPGYSHINKFGYRNNFSKTAYETIWDGSTAYQYQSAANVSAVADDSADDGGTVSVQGLDQNYNLIEETITIGGTASSNQFVRVFRAILLTPGAGLDTNKDEVRIKNNSTDVAIILAGAGQTLMSLYTVPAGKTAYLVKFQGSVDANNNAIFRIVARPDGGAFATKAQFGTFSNNVEYTYNVPLQFEEKTDIEIRSFAPNNLGGGAIFDLVLVDNT